MMNDKVKIGITHGDVNGIGYEVIMKSLLDNRIYDICTPVLYGSAKVAAYHRKAIGIENFSLNNIKSPDEANPKRANLINCIDVEVRVELGKATKMAGEASLAALEAATRDLQDKKIDVLVTAPIHKQNIQSDNFKFPGHTEYLSSKFDSSGVLMLMISEIMRIGVVTGHIPLSEVPGKLTRDLIISKLRILNQSLVQDFGIRKPRIAVLGLNPHAGDNGVIGNEEQITISPAIEAAREENIMALGPYPSDGFFGSGQFSKFDAILAMYHDQGLTPFKSLSYEGGVNFTAGLPVIRTSPAHGTAYEIAGKNEASEDAFRKAIYLAVDVFNNRLTYKELTKNPLKSSGVITPEADQ